MALAEIFGPDLLIVLIIVVVVLFGGAAIPKLARNLGSAKNQFEKGMKDGNPDAGTSKASDTSKDAPAQSQDQGNTSPS
jgi:sec-independent protein translocase protein TatA